MFPNFNICSTSSTVILDKVNNLNTKLNRNANLVLLSEPNKYIGNSKDDVDEKISSYKPNPKLKNIDFKIKNNSCSRKHFFVIGPKKDGSSFSYGFPMMPGASKSERLTIGSKIYQEGKMGSKDLLVTIIAENEGQVVKLF